MKFFLEMEHLAAIGVGVRNAVNEVLALKIVISYYRWKKTHISFI